MDYDNKPSHYYNKVRYEMLKYLPKEAKTILEVGCGNGCFIAEIKKTNQGEFCFASFFLTPSYFLLANSFCLLIACYYKIKKTYIFSFVFR